MTPRWKTAWRVLETLNIEVSYDPAIPFLGFGPERITIQNDTRTLTFRAALLQQPRHRIHHRQKNEDYVLHLCTGILLSHKTEENIDTGRSKDVPRNYHPNGVNQGEKDRYPTGAHTDGTYKFIPRNRVQNRNRLADRENQAVTTKGQSEGRGTLRVWYENKQIDTELIMKKDQLNTRGNSTEQTVITYLRKKQKKNRYASMYN